MSNNLGRTILRSVRDEYRSYRGLLGVEHRPGDRFAFGIEQNEKRARWACFRYGWEQVYLVSRARGLGSFVPAPSQ